MITRIKTDTLCYHSNGSVTNEIKVRGLSTDEKPTDVPNGTGFYEMDKVDGKNRYFLFDEENNQWLEQ